MSRDNWQPHTFTTPRGHRAVFALRKDTNDFNTVNSVMSPHDEYRLKNADLSGLAFDIGCHIGGVAVAMLLDNPGLKVVALEPVPPNAEGAIHNAKTNDVGDRFTMIQGAAADPTKGLVHVEYDFVGSETAEHHAWIGNSTAAMNNSDLCKSVSAEPWDLARLIEVYGVPSYAKVDCEGGEFGFLANPDAVAQVPVIVGEWHPVYGNTRDDFAKLLAGSHIVTWDGPEAGPGNFFAGRRA